jgi:hypothetical protein
MHLHSKHEGSPFHLGHGIDSAEFLVSMFRNDVNPCESSRMLRHNTRRSVFMWQSMWTALKFHKLSGYVGRLWFHIILNTDTGM